MSNSIVFNLFRSTSLIILSLFLFLCQHFFKTFLFLSVDRISRNGEGGIWTLAPLLTTCTLSRGVPSASLGTSPVEYFTYSFFKHSSKKDERREWDSNPRALADKRFSRPPRYDHFDISPTTFPQSRELCLQLSRCFISSPLLKSAQKWFYHLLDQLSI